MGISQTTSAAFAIQTFNVNGQLFVAAGVGRFRFPFPATILGITLAINTPPTGAAVIVDVNKILAATPTVVTTIFTTQGNRPTIAIGAYASAAEMVPDVTAYALGDFMTMDTDQIGSTVAGSDLTAIIRYRPVG
jgi:hypothetical protein